MNDLAYADEDVKTFGTILKEYGGYADSDMQLLLNEKATKQKIAAALLELVKESQKHPFEHFTLMYAGHGLPSTIDASKTNSYLAPHDAYLNQFFPEGAGGLIGNDTFINKAWLVKQLSSMNAKNIVIILDSCYSGAKDFGELYADNLGFKTEFTTGGMGKRDIVVVRKKGSDAALDRRIAFLASSRENQPSAEYTELRHGALSYTIFHYLEQVRNDTEVGDPKTVSMSDMFGGISNLFDSVQVKGESLSHVHQPVLFPIPDYDGVKNMPFLAVRGIKPTLKPPLIADSRPVPAAPGAGELYVDTAGEACEVRLDNDPGAKASNSGLTLTEGRHLVSVYLARTRYNQTFVVDVKAGDKKKLNVAMQGRLGVESYTPAFSGGAPALDVYLDGQSLGRSTLRRKDILVGTHELMVVVNGVQKSRQIEIRADSPLLVRYKVVRLAAPSAPRDDNGAGDVTF